MSERNLYKILYKGCGVAERIRKNMGEGGIGFPKERKRESEDNVVLTIYNNNKAI